MMRPFYILPNVVVVGIFFILITSTLRGQSLDSLELTEFQNYIQWSTKYARQKQFDSAAIYTERLHILAGKYNAPDLIGLKNYNNGKIQYWQGNIEEAKRILEESFTIDSLVSDSIKLKTRGMYSEILRYDNDYTNALRHLLDAEKIILQKDLLTQKDSLALDFFYINIAGIHFVKKNNEQAMDYCKRSLRFSVNDKSSGHAYHLMSQLLEAENRWEEALAYSFRSLEKVRKWNHEVFLPSRYAEISKYYLKLKKADSSIYYARLGLTNNMDCTVDHLYNNLGDALVLKGEYRMALKQFEQALQYATSEEMTMTTHKNMSEVYTALGDFKKALYHNEAYISLKEIVEGRKVRQEIVAITEQYESNKKELQIEMLNSKNEHNHVVIQKQRSQLWLIGSLLALMVLMLGLIYYFYTRQKQQQGLLYAKNVQLAEQLKKRERKPVKAMNTAVMNKEAHGLDEEKLEMIKASISQFIKSELFLERDMTLAKLAKSIETNTSYLSKVINSYYGSTFTNFMNELRISYTLKSLEAVPEFREFTIDHIAERSGFASSSAFYKAFKKHTGLTPSYYIKKRLHQHAQSV